MINRLKRKGKSEKGQAMLEFALVIPIFILILALIFDYGWLFYNQLQLENTARNAARIACIDYADVCVTPAMSMRDTPPTREFSLSDSGTWTKKSEKGAELLSDGEREILEEVEHSLPSSVQAIKGTNLPKATVKITYSYDQDCYDGVYNNIDDEYYTNRYKGDVTVVIQANHHAITPFSSLTEANTEHPLDRSIYGKSVYRVEKSH